MCQGFLWENYGLPQLNGWYLKEYIIHLRTKILDLQNL